MLDIDLKVPFDMPRKLCGWYARRKSLAGKNKQGIDLFSKVKRTQVFPAEAPRKLRG